MATDSRGDRKAGQGASAGGWHYAGTDSRTSQTIPHGQTADPEEGKWLCVQGWWRSGDKWVYATLITVPVEC